MTTMSPRRFYNPQLDLFLPNIVDLRFRDQKDTMERPFFFAPEIQEDEAH
jgi:hypothetical protein